MGDWRDQVMFPFELTIHPEADLSVLVGELLSHFSIQEDYFVNGMDAWVPEVEAFREICATELTELQLQCLIRRYRLDKKNPPLPLVGWAAIARQRGGDKGHSIKGSVDGALKKLREPLRQLRKKELLASDSWRARSRSLRP